MITLKDIIINSKKTGKERKAGQQCYSVQIDFDICDKASVTETVMADSPEEAEQQAYARISAMTLQELQRQAARKYDENGEVVRCTQNVRTIEVKTRKRPQLSSNQKEVLDLLARGLLIQHNYYSNYICNQEHELIKVRRTVLVWHPKLNTNIKVKKVTEYNVSRLTFVALYNKGLIVQVELKDASAKEIEVRTAIGELGKFKHTTYFCINEKVAKLYGIEIKTSLGNGQA